MAVSDVGKLESSQLKSSYIEETFEWKIENFKSIDSTVGVSVRSPELRIAHLDSKNVTWHLRLYPGGRKEENADYLGLYLYYVGDSTLLPSFGYKFVILDAKRKPLATFETTTSARNSNNGDQRGTSRFCLKNVIYDETKKALVNDTLLISCTITGKSTVPNEVHCNADNSAKSHFENLLENGNMSDVTFKIGNEKLQLHKAILTSLSPVFLAMFEHQMKEKEESVVKITDEKYEIMKELFRYIYARKVYQIESIASDLFVAADKYDVQGLKLMCENTLIQNLSVDNALQNFVLAMNYNNTILKCKVIEFIVESLEEFVDKPEFDQLDAICKGELLRAIGRKKVKYAA